MKPWRQLKFEVIYFRPGANNNLPLPRLEPRRDDTLIMRPFNGGQFLVTRETATMAEADVEPLTETCSNFSRVDPGVNDGLDKRRTILYFSKFCLEI